MSTVRTDVTSRIHLWTVLTLIAALSSLTFLEVIRKITVGGFIVRLDSARPWTTPVWSPERVAADLALEALGREFQAFPYSDARLVVERFSALAMRKSGTAELDAQSKLYVLLRFYFDVPEKERRGEAEYFGNWLGGPYDDAHVYLIWPVSVTDGNVRITGAYKGYLGETYDALGEFDFFASRYNRRAAGCHPTPLTLFGQEKRISPIIESRRPEQVRAVPAFQRGTSAEQRKRLFRPTRLPPHQRPGGQQCGYRFAQHAAGERHRPDRFLF